MTAASSGSRCLPSWETAQGALSRARCFALPRLAGRRVCRASSSRYETSTRPLLCCFSRARMEATRALTTSAGGCLHEHDCGPLEHPAPRCSRARRLPCSGRKSPSDRCSRRRSRGQGPSKPMLGIPGRDCSRPRFRPNPDRSGHLSSQDAVPCRSGATRWGSGAANAGRACKARSAEGRCGGGHPRRCPALTGPRCLLSQGRSRTNGHCR